jgi:hypothetical protein
MAAPPPTPDDIDVRFEADYDAPTLRDDRPMLTWGAYPPYGNGWQLWYLEDPASENSGVDMHFIPGDLTEVDIAVRQAQSWLELRAQSQQQGDDD